MLGRKFIIYMGRGPLRSCAGWERYIQISVAGSGKYLLEDIPKIARKLYYD
jgi:hypothetical protein